MAVSDNWQKASPSTTFGTPALDFYVVDMGTDVEGEGDWADSNSLFAKAVRGVQLVANLYFVGKPNGNYFTVAVASGTCPDRNPGAISGVNATLTARVNEASGISSATVYYAEHRGNNMVWDD
jgi:hypothetical protein